MRYITHEAISALALHNNPFCSAEAVAKMRDAVATLRPHEQKAITKHYLVGSCEDGCEHGNDLQEGLRSLSHYYPTGGMRPSDLR